MSSRKRASLSNNSPLDQLFGPTTETSPAEEETQETATTEETHERRDPDRDAPSRRDWSAPVDPPRTAKEQPFVRPTPAAAQGEPQAERELRQTTIMIYGDQADWLDEACYLARRQTGNNISKAAILRALVDMAREDDIVRQRLRERLGV
jgi:hypothetical protein